MEYIIDKDKAFLRLDKEQDLFSSILKVANDEKWQSAHISGIGALKDIELGYYNIDSKTYTRKKFNDSHELINLDGNLSILEGKRFLHLHTTLSNKDFQCIGGHLFSALISVSCEVNIRLFTANVTRKLNDIVGLPCINFDNCRSEL